MVRQGHDPVHVVVMCLFHKQFSVFCNELFDFLPDLVYKSPRLHQSLLAATSVGIKLLFLLGQHAEESQELFCMLDGLL